MRSPIGYHDIIDPFWEVVTSGVQLSEVGVESYVALCVYVDTHIDSVSPPTTPPAMRRATRRATASFVHGITRSQLRYCFVGFP